MPRTCPSLNPRKDRTASRPTRPRRHIVVRLAVVVSAAFAFTLPLRAADVTSTWNVGAGNWGVNGNWINAPAIGGFPNNGNGGVATYDAVLANGSTITLDQNTTIQKFTLSSGTLTGGFNLTLNDNLSWTGGTMSGSGITNADGGISLVGGGTRVLIGRTLNNALGQSATLSGASATLNVGSGAVFNNLGTFLAQNNQAFANNGGAASTFNNPGTFTRNTGTGTFSIGFNGVFNNAGTVNVQTGTLCAQHARWRQHHRCFQHLQRRDLAVQ